MHPNLDPQAHRLPVLPVCMDILSSKVSAHEGFVPNKTFFFFNGLYLLLNVSRQYGQLLLLLFFFSFVITY